MASNVLPQSLHVIPVSHGRCALKKSGFLAFVPGRHLSSGVSASSRVVLKSTGGLNFGKKLVDCRRNFIVQAETDSEAVDSENAENEEVIEESPEAELESEAVETEEKPPRKPIIKLGDIMGILNKRAIEASDEQRPTPDIRTGDVVEIKLEVPENRRRLSVYKGIVISKQNAGIHTTIRIRRIIAGIGVEIVFPVYSPNIKEIRVLSHRKVRRARLYYLREKLPRLSTFK